MEAREQKGLEIAAKSRLTREGNTWLVPSQAGKGKYVVDSDAKQCTCPDFEARQATCKHIFAVEYTIQREYTDDGETQTYTETVTVKKTYKQEWTAYNEAQTHEKERFLSLLADLCKGIEEAPQPMGRKRLPLADMIFASAFKVYSTVSGRRFTTDLKDAHSKGYLSKAPHYNSVSRYLENPGLTPLLKALIEESSLPLQAIESDFAVDSSGFSTSRFVQWMQAKYTDPHLVQKRGFIKCHIMCGVKTNIITSVEMTDGRSADSPQFKPLVEATAKNFIMQEVSADKAYLSNANLQTVVDNHAQPYIPFKSNSTTEDRWQKTRSSRTAIWKQMYHLYSYNSERFMESYHKRSNVETTFHMIKAKFGIALRSKTKTAQVNEALCKVLCHNICVVIQSIYELGIEPTFWSEPNESSH
ncbi:MAG TPA: transposase [Pyrinomonadaceae bacterium]|nr:transposase [Pyrinomonadaceae bacterium]